MSKNSTRKPRRRKAAWEVAGFSIKRPYPDFPLCPHTSGSWQKKIRGKIAYFGKWAKRENGKLVRIEGDGWTEALELYKAQADDLHAGRTPRAVVNGSGVTVKDLGDRFLTAKDRSLKSGELGARQFEEYRATAQLVADTLGKSRLVTDLAADDFESLRNKMAERWGPTRLGNEIQKVRTLFKYGYESGLIVAPIRYGPQFKKPSASVMRRHKSANGERMLEAIQLRNLITAAPIPLKAMLLLGINAGLGNHDCALLPLSALDLERGWLNFPRPKTGIAHRCPLWPETVAALRDAIAQRPDPRTEDSKEKVFVTSRGRSWLVNGIANPVSVAARDLMKAEEIHGKGIGFYTLRHVFRTITDGTRDQVAINHIMGHADATIAATYRERIEDSRLVAVAEHARQWLFGKPPADDKGETGNEDYASRNPRARGRH